MNVSKMSSSLLSLALSILFVYVASLIYKRLIFYYKLSWIPGPSAWPIIGNYGDLIGATPEDVFLNMIKFFKKYGKTYKVWIGSTPVVHCQDPEILQVVYKQEDKTLKTKMYALSSSYIGAGLLMGEGDDKWKFQRRYLSDSFHSDIVANNAGLTSHKMKMLSKMFDKMIKSPGMDEPIDLVPYMKRAFFDVSVGSVVGVESNCLEESISGPYLKGADSMSDIVMARIFSPIFKYKFLFDISPLKKTNDKVIESMKTYIRNVINERDMIANHKNTGKHDIITDRMLKLVKDNPLITNDDVENQVSNNIFAAYDTMSTITSLLLFVLGNDQKLQEKVLMEINDNVPNILKDGITAKESNNLQLLDRCVKETLRMFPAAPMIGRYIDQPIATKNGVMPAGVEVYTNMYTFHRNEEIYQNPNEFNPNRFLPENFNKLPPYSWIPFGIGIRSCIGQKTALMQIKVAVSMIVKKYSIKSYEGINDLQLSANLVIKSKNGVRVFIKPRT